MQSGTNAVHGAVVDHLVIDGLNAGLPFADRCVQDGRFRTSTDTRQHLRNRTRRTDYGFTLGGPLWLPTFYDGRNKSFFFVNFEQYRTSNTTSTGLATVPTRAYGTGDFSAALCSSYDRRTAERTGGID